MASDDEIVVTLAAIALDRGVRGVLTLAAFAIGDITGSEESLVTALRTAGRKYATRDDMIKEVERLARRAIGLLVLDMEGMPVDATLS